MLPLVTSHLHVDYGHFGSADRVYMFPYRLLIASNLDAEAMKPEIN